MLIDSPRLSDADRDTWRQWSAMDSRMATAMAGRLDRLTETARQVIEDFTAAGPCYLSCSWGKDSVLILHLLVTSPAAARVPTVYVTHDAASADRAENPDCAEVREAFFAQFGPLPGGYQELTGRVAGRRSTLAQDMGTSRRITGLRAAESDQREMSRRRHGAATGESCRPIIAWTDQELWAYTARHDLPVHPAYAMTYGGQLDRSRLRVHSFGGQQGGLRRWQWEDDYYGDITKSLRSGRLLPRDAAYRDSEEETC